MLRLVSKALLVLLLACCTQCQRRIYDGQRVNKSFVVYLVWDTDNEESLKNHDIYTICGGFLLTTSLVGTSRTCLLIYPTQHVIAGYNKYVPRGLGRNDEEKECLKIARRTIVEKYYHGGPQLQLGSQWIYQDYAYAKLDAPYDDDEAFTQKCSYQPTVAKNRIKKTDYPKPGTDVVMYGWGSAHYQRPETHMFDINESYLRATTTIVMELKQCKKKHGEFKRTNIFNYRVCTDGPSGLNVHGVPIEYRRGKTNNNTQERNPFTALSVPRLLGNDSIVSSRNMSTNSRRGGACQNDHGGPVATWIDGEETVIGILNAYLVNGEMECVGPTIFLYLGAGNDLKQLFEEAKSS